jgi:DNA primase
MAIPQTFIQELLARADVVDIVGRYVSLKKAGANYSGLCPFHAEKSPSFTVSPTKQFYHCFGCGKNGNAIGFLMEHAGMNFVEAVKDLAQTYGLQVPEEEISPQEQQRASEQKHRQASITEILEKACTSFRNNLKQSPQAIEYLKQRGLSGEIAKQYGLGYALPGWRSMASVFPNYQDPNLVESGLVISQSEESDAGEEKRYDRFRDRIMFPIRNIKGECIGFGGRVMGQGTPKYLNSPETPVFSKGRELYGLFEARHAIRDAGFVLVTEGYMDVVALAQLGFPHAVATLGTACTTDHVHKLFRFTDSVVFSFDGDAAGRRAARKALDGALPYATDTRNIKFLFLPAEHDPDSFIRQHGADAFARYIADASPLSRFVIDIAREGCDLQTAEGRALLASQARPMCLSMPEGVLRSQLIGELAKSIGIGMHELLQLWQPDKTGSTVKTGSRRNNSRSSKNRRTPASRQDRAIQLLFSSMASWNNLSGNQHALLCGLPNPHGAAFLWLEQQFLELGPLNWAAIREGLRGHELENWLAGLVESAPADLEFDMKELNSILLELEKAEIASQLTEMAPRVGSNPQLYEQFKRLNARLSELKTGTMV